MFKKRNHGRFNKNIVVILTLIFVLGYINPAVYGVSFPDYFPLDPAIHGLKTFKWTYGDIGTYQSYISGTLTVPYTSGAIEGTGIVNYLEFSTLYATNNGTEVKLLATTDEDDFDKVSYFSTDQYLSAHPESCTFSIVTDDMFWGERDYYLVDYNLASFEKDGDLILFDIQDVNVPFNQYSDAVIIWNIDPEFSFTDLDFHGKDIDLGITLPSSSQTKGYSVTSMLIYAYSIGMVAYGDINDATGELTELAELVNQTFDQKYGGGKGKSNDPFLIYTAEQMSAIGTNSKDWDKHFKLMADIDLSAFAGVEFNIIGYWNSYADNHPFTGLFDGNGYTLKNFTYAAQHQDNVGLFGCLGIGGEIKNLGLENVNIEIMDPGFEGSPFYPVNGHFIAGLVAWNVFGTINNCYVTGNVKGNRMVGGLVARNCGMIINCYSTANVFAEDDAGGLVGWNDFGTITNSHATGDITGEYRIGGLVGPNWGQISNCHAVASIIGREDTIGGLVGENEFNGIITKCYSTGSVWARSQSEEVGGLAGENSSIITNCYSTCSVSGGDYVGGLVGYKDGGMVSHCYSTGSVDGNDSVGGLVGYHDDYSISFCYSTGRVVGNHDVGGLVGYNESDANVLNSFWDTQTTNQTDGVGFDEGGSAINIFGLITAEMMQQATFTNEGWDFVDETEDGTEDIWWILEGQDYPRLWWEAAEQ